MNTFSSFFINIIFVFHSSFPSDSNLCVLNPEGLAECNFCVTTAEVCYLVLLAPCKSSDLDPIPTCLVKDCIDILITSMTYMVKLSLSEGSFPSHFKSALVSPLLMKPTLNKDNMKNDWPVSNLGFLSKVLEEVEVN